MIPFDGNFAANTVLPLALAAYDTTTPPDGFVLDQTAFEILANTGTDEYLVQEKRSSDKHKQMLQSMLHQPDQHQATATDASVRTLAASPNPNLHFGWVCLKQDTLIVAFRGTEFIHEWFDDFDFIPGPYGPIPGRGTVHQGFQLVYYSIRASLRNLVGQNAAKCKQLLITGHSLGAALCALAVS